MLQSGVRVIGSLPAPHLVVGEKRAPIGTGFFMTVPSARLEGLRYGYVLTAHHVIWEQNRVEVQAADPTANGELHPPLEINDWRQPLPNVDLAVAPFNPSAGGRIYQSLELERTVLPPSKQPALGATVYYVGILMPLDRPMARAGTIGAVDQVGIDHDGGYEYPAHLLDCRSYGGFSGSPCFVELAFPSLTPIELSPFVELAPGPVGDMNYTSLLCGMLTEHLSDSDTSVASRYGVGTMLRSNEIWEALMTDEMRDERRTWDAHNEAATEAADQPRLKGASAEVKDEFERFEDLARKLVNTPKVEVDEK